MASPRLEVLFFYDASTGLPKTGLVPTFLSYTDETNANQTQPGITEIGNGAYKFTSVPATGHGICYVVDGTAAATPRYQARYVRPEDWNPDNADTLSSGILTITQDLQIVNNGKWVIPTSGLDANKLVLYALDGVTILRKFALFDTNGNPTTVNPYQRVPSS